MSRRWLQERLPGRALLQKRLVRSAGGRVKTWLAGRLADGALWHLNRHSVAGGVALGLFVSWIPIPLQMVVAACAAAVMRVHVPVSVVMVWFTNPLTVAPLLYLAWRVGSMATGRTVSHEPFTLSLQGLYHGAMTNWPVVLLGCLICAVLSAALGWVATHLLWRLNVLRQRRCQQRARLLRARTD